MKSKKIATLALTFMLASSVLGSVASANNWQDTTYSFNFSSVSSVKLTDPRIKLDKSKSYIKCTDTKYAFSVHVNGTNSTSLTAANYDCSNGHSYTINKGDAKYLTNVVNENGYKYARLRASSNYGFAYTATGVWSPDNYAGIGN